nr:integrase, catalytic region, zinc finger, CCHC-type, peptidase aspartic, catalytic [Tanacetum cinerariifolium]
MTDYSLWDVILNGDSPIPTKVVDGVFQPIAPTTVEQRLDKVKSWKLLESCGVYILTLTTTQMILLVEKKYHLKRFTLEQMLNNVMLEVEEESEMSLKLPRVVDGVVQPIAHTTAEQRLTKVKSWKLLESCGVYILTLTTTQMILLVEKKYPLKKFTLEQMLNNVRLEVEEESEMSLELLRLNSNGNGNYVAVRAEGNAIGNNGIQLQAEEFDLMAAAADLDEIEEVNANCILMYTDLLEPIFEPHQVQQNDNNVISEVSSVEQDGGTIDQHPATVKETRVYFESLYNNLIIEIEKPRSNTKNDRLPSASKSSYNKNQEIEVEEHPRNLLLSKNKKHMSSECNNVKLAIRNDKFEVVCAMCKKCLITTNHDVCLLNYVNDTNSRGKKLKANVSNTKTQKKQKPKVMKPKKVIQICLWCVDSGCSKHMTENLKLLINFVWKFLGTVCFGNDHVAVILGFSDLQWGNIMITKVYFVEGLGHNLFSVGQFYDSDLEVAFRRNTCFIKNLEGVDLLKRNRTINLYTINLHEMASASLICLMARATSTKSWLWHQRLSHLNFDTINDLAKNNIVTEAARTMLIFSCAPLYLWAEVIATTCYTQNLSIIHRRFNKTPYKLINGRKPDISFLHVFGALCYPKIDREDIGKLGAKCDIGFFIGYSTDSCAYIVYN